MSKKIYDIAIIGGGINGTGIAVDAAGRGLSVVLCEKNDLGHATSSASSKLIHGGIRYLESLDFRLVRESLNEREVLLYKAPHLVRPLRFIMPNVPSIRSTFLIKIGLFLYDHLAKNLSLPKSEFIPLTALRTQDHLQPSLKNAFCYSDCTVDDSRLVIANALSAQNYGADILTYTNCVGAKREALYWRIRTESQTAAHQEIFAKAIVNATGPWAEFFLRQLRITTHNKLILVKGSHIIVPRIYADQHAYLLQHVDKRVVFIIPYLDRWTLIGTTDVIHKGKPEDIAISQDEINYLCEITNRYFTINLKPTDVLYSYTGVRPLKGNYDDNPSKVSRDYTLEIMDENNSLPILSVFGGKITTYRKLAEAVLNNLRKYFPNMGADWTAKTSLAGGDIPKHDFTTFLENCYLTYPTLNKNLVTRYAKQYGSFIHSFLKDIKTTTDLGEDFGNELYYKELEYLVQHEWVKTAEDVLWRRTKLGYVFPKDKIQHLNTVIQALIKQFSAT